MADDNLRAIYKGFVLENASKVHRTIHGSQGGEGKLVGGLGESASDDDILAEYDKLGGYIS